MHAPSVDTALKGQKCLPCQSKSNLLIPQGNEITVLLPSRSLKDMFLTPLSMCLLQRQPTWSLDPAVSQHFSLSLSPFLCPLQVHECLYCLSSRCIKTRHDDSMRRYCCHFACCLSEHQHLPVISGVFNHGRCIFISFFSTYFMCSWYVIHLYSM